MGCQKMLTATNLISELWYVWYGQTRLWCRWWIETKGNVLIYAAQTDGWCLKWEDLGKILRGTSLSFVSDLRSIGDKSVLASFVVIFGQNCPVIVLSYILTHSWYLITWQKWFFTKTTLLSQIETSLFPGRHKSDTSHAHSPWVRCCRH